MIFFMLLFAATPAYAELSCQAIFAEKELLIKVATEGAADMSPDRIYALQRRMQYLEEHEASCQSERDAESSSVLVPNPEPSPEPSQEPSNVDES